MRRPCTRTMLGLLALLFGAGAGEAGQANAAGDVAPKAEFYVIANLREDDANMLVFPHGATKAGANQYDPCDQPDTTTADDIVKELEKHLPLPRFIPTLLGCVGNKERALSLRLRASEVFEKLVPKLKPYSTFPRIYATRGDAVTIATIHTAAKLWYERQDGTRELFLVRGPTAEVTMKEEARRLRIVSDFILATRLAAAIAARSPAAARVDAEAIDPSAVESEPAVWVSAKRATFTLGRATATVTSTLGKVSGTLAHAFKTDEGLNLYLASERQYQAVAAALEADEGATALEKRRYEVLKTALKDRSCGAAPAGTPAAAQPAAAPAAPLSLTSIHLLLCVATNGQPFPSATTPTLEWDVATRVAAIKALQESGELGALPILRELVNAPKAPAEIRRAAVSAVVVLGRVPAAPTPAPAPAETPAATAEAKAPPTATGQLLTGSAEHLFLSADVLLTPTTKLQFDEKTGMVENVDAPTAFYLGIDWQLGDILREYGARDIVKNLVVKGMIKAGKRPLESVGVGLGLRGSYFKSFGIDFDLISPFVAVIWTKEDAPEATAENPSQRRTPKARFGISLNLDKALGWVKK